MQIQRINTSPMELVNLEELKAHMRIDHNAEDTILKSLQRAAYDWIEQFTGRSILTSEWKYLTTGLKASSEVRHALPFPNLLGVESVHHVFPNSKREKIKRFTLDQRFGVEYLCMMSKGVPIEIVYSAGFGPHPRFVPEAFHQALKILVAHWYEQREGCDVPATVDTILRPYQIRRLA